MNEEKQKFNAMYGKIVTNKINEEKQKNKELFIRYKNMKSLTKICEENGVRVSNVDKDKKIIEEKQKIIKKEIIKEVTEMYNYIVFEMR